MFFIKFLLLHITWLCYSSEVLSSLENKPNFSNSNHTNNWAVLVAASRFWFNYRHLSNTLSFYRTVKRLGIPDSNIILMLSDDVACNPRNIFPGMVFQSHDHHLELYGDDIEVDYRGYEVTVENFVRLLTNRLPPSTPKSKLLRTDKHSNVLVYLSGHGGDNFLKFQDSEEITAQEIADTFEQMSQKERFNELLFIVDTCEANTLYSKIYSKNIIAMGSSEVTEKAYSYDNDPELGLSVIDRFTHYTLEFMENVNPGSHITLKQLIDVYNRDLLGATPGFMTDKSVRPMEEILVTDFFGSVQSVHLTEMEPSQLERNSSQVFFQYEAVPEDLKNDESTAYSQLINYVQQFLDFPVNNFLMKLRSTSNYHIIPMITGISVLIPMIYALSI